jgi:hypothetical protein
MDLKTASLITAPLGPSTRPEREPLIERIWAHGAACEHCPHQRRTIESAPYGETSVNWHEYTCAVMDGAHAGPCPEVEHREGQLLTTDVLADALAEALGTEAILYPLIEILRRRDTDPLAQEVWECLAEQL